MVHVSQDKLLELLRRSRLVSDAQLREFLDRLNDAPSDERPQDATQLAEAMVNARLINQWHAENLLNEKYKGFILGKYKLLGHLGTGGMSSVFLAEHPVMERLVAIKVLPKRYVEDQNYLDRFRREARAAAALDHPNIVRAYDIDNDGDRHYIVMEYVEGRDMQKLIKEDGPLSDVAAADYIAQAARGLQHAHDAGLVHRDVKPANCLVDTKGVLKLLDMGLAKFSQDDRPALSAIYDDSVVGTADYLAPEQAVDSQRVDSRADIYSLGCTLYFLLTGQPPFPEGTIAERLLKHQTEEPVPLYKLRPDVSPLIAELCRRMMIKSRDDRIQFASVVDEELSAWLTARGRSLLPAAHQVGAHGSSKSASDSSTRWSRQSSFSSTGPGALPHSPASGETVSSSQTDTVKIGSGDSSINDNLTLAPLDEEKSHDDDEQRAAVDAEDAHDTQNDSSIDELDLEMFGSGPLDSLFEDKEFVEREIVPSRSLTTPQPTFVESHWLAISIVGCLSAIAIVTVLTLIFM